MRSATVAISALLTGFTWVTFGCSSEDERSVGPDCRIFLSVAEDAEACDPELERLTDALRADPNEARCATAARRLLGAAPPRSPQVRSLSTPTPPPSGGALTAQERERLAATKRPAHVVLAPDLRPEPGLAPTRASIGDLTLEPDDEGRLRASLVPGLHSLVLRHAGQESVFCLELRACETLAVTIHGPKLARHPDVRPGPC